MQKSTPITRNWNNIYSGTHGRLMQLSFDAGENIYSSFVDNHNVVHFIESSGLNWNTIVSFHLPKQSVFLFSLCSKITTIPTVIYYIDNSIFVSKYDKKLKKWDVVYDQLISEINDLKDIYNIEFLREDDLHKLSIRFVYKGADFILVLSSTNYDLIKAPVYTYGNRFLTIGVDRDGLIYCAILHEENFPIELRIYKYEKSSWVLINDPAKFDNFYPFSIDFDDSKNPYIAVYGTSDIIGHESTGGHIISFQTGDWKYLSDSPYNTDRLFAQKVHLKGKGVYVLFQEDGTNDPYNIILSCKYLDPRNIWQDLGNQKFTLAPSNISPLDFTSFGNKYYVSCLSTTGLGSQINTKVFQLDLTYGEEIKQ